MLDIRLLGTPLVYFNEELISINRRATRALLFYLAANQEPVGRPQLCQFLWSKEGDEKKQRKKLRVTLGNLNKAIPDINIIKTYHETVALDSAILHVDLHDFSSALSKMRHYAASWHNRNTLPLGLYQNLVEAADLWRSMTFIDNADMYFSEDTANWWSQKNRELRQERGELYKFLSRFEDRAGKTRGAASWAHKALRIDEYDEEAHYLYLLGLSKSNQREKGLHHFRLIEDELAPEFDGFFSERINTLGSELSRKIVASPSQVRPEWSIKANVHTPFVGQRDSIQILKKSYFKGKAVLILGEGGAGKTRLVQEFYQSLAVPHRLLLLACQPTGENLPYQPWIGMLREVDEETWNELPDIWCKPLMVLLPELREGRSGLSEEMEQPYANPIIFEAIKNLLVLLAEKEPCVLFLDDAQWADEATSALITYLVEQSFFTPQNLSLVIASRIEKVNVGLEKLLLGTLQDQIALIEMLRLREKDISELAFYLFHKNLPPEVSARLLRDTGGNPFLVLEMLSAYGALSNQEMPDFHLPISANAKELIEMRLAKLSPLARDILLLAAIQGNPFDFALLEKSANLSLAMMTNTIEELEKTQLIQKIKKKGRLEYTFIHEIIRETLISSLSAIRSLLLHKKVAQALEEISRQQPDRQAAVLAALYEKGGEFSRAFNLWVQAGRYAYYLLSIKDAIVAYEHAESLIKGTTLQDKQIYDLYTSWQMMLSQNDDADALEEVMQTFLSIGKERTSKLLIGAALDGMSDVYFVRNEFDKGLDCIDEALPYLKGNLTVAEMNAEIHRGVFLYMLSQFSESQEPIQNALLLGKNTQNPDILAASGYANYHMAVTWVGMGWPARGIEYGKRSLRELTLSRASYGPVVAHSIMGLGHYYLANY